MKLALGTGGKVYNGWVCCDLTPSHPQEHRLDVTEPLPFPDNSVSFIHSENMLEHITYQQNQALMKEIHRVLKPGGVARLVTHGLFPMLCLMQSELTDVQKRYIQWVNKEFAKTFGHDGGDNPTFTLNQAFYGHGHKFLFDKRTLTDLIRQFGFTSALWCAMNNSNHADLSNMERHGEVIPQEFYDLEALIVEVTK